MGGRRPGTPKTGGRAKGTPNKTTQSTRDLADKLGVNPLEVLLLIAKGDWKNLGYESGEIERVADGGMVIVMERITLDQRLSAARDACRYIFHQLKALDHTVGAENGIRIVVEDYTTKGKK